MSRRPFMLLTLEEALSELKEIGLEAFRLRQIRKWVFQKNVFDFEAMTDLSKDARSRLAERFSGVLPSESSKLIDPDGTVKLAITLLDGEVVEAVALPDSNTKSMTFCLSSQVGCIIGCPFCKTGATGFKRDLTSEEILVQLLMLMRAVDQKPTNIVFMGMGEPFFNRDNLFAAIDIMCDPQALGFASRRITISTSGVVEGIQALIERPGEVNLAISLHSAEDNTRNRLVPINKKYPLAMLRRAIADYIEATGRRVTFEILLLKNENDQLNDALNLVEFCNGLTCHVNILRFNSFAGQHFKPTDKKTEKEFKKVLEKAGIPVTIRRSRGQTIMAACGQLSGKAEK